MIEDDIAIHVIGGIIDACRRIIGENAIKTANEVDGLDVRSNGEIVVTGDDVYTIIGSLCGEYEKALHGRVVVDVDVRVNLRKRGT